MLRGLGDVHGGTPYASSAPPWAQCQLAGAWMLRLSDAEALTWQTAPVPGNLEDMDLVLIFRVAFGNGSPWPQQTGKFDLMVDGRHLLSFTGVKHRERWNGDGGDFLFLPDIVRAARPGEGLALDEQLKSESWAAEGLGLLRLRRDWISPGEPLKIQIMSGPSVPSENWFRLGLPAFDFEALACDDALEQLLALDSPPRVGDRLVLFGDMHNHTGEGGWPGLVCGLGSRVEALSYARDVSGLDFCCLSEHDWQLADGEWEGLQDLNDEWDLPGAFVTLHGYEWTSASYGHRNVYFLHRGGPFVRTGPYHPEGDPDLYMGAVNARGDHQHDPTTLWEALDRWGGRAMTIPHHTSSAMFPLSLERFFHAEYDRVAEIYSCWGDSLHHESDLNLYAQRIAELELSRFVERFPIGFIASSDSHDGHPGNAQGHQRRRHLFHPVGSGQVAVHAEDFTREAIFSAIYDRRCYALTGERMILDVTMNGHPMGALVRTDSLTQSPVLSISASSAVACDRIEVFNGSRLVHSENLGRSVEHFDWEDPSFTGEATYYIRAIRQDWELAWSSPIRVQEEAP